MFGRDVQDFATPLYAFVTCWRFLLGDFDWSELQKVSTTRGFVFFFGFSLLVILIMLNMLLAIILETYIDVKRLTGKSETLYSQAWETFSRWIRKKRHQRVGLDFIRDRLLHRGAVVGDCWGVVLLHFARKSRGLTSAALIYPGRFPLER